MARQLYDAWGNIRASASSGTMPTDIGYTGQRLDSYIKLVQMGARWYDPTLGRWLSPDSIVPDPKNPQSLNRFSYSNNNPLRYSDPTGHEGNDVVDQLQKSKRFSDSIMDLIRKLSESDTGSKLLTFLLQNTDITIQWASAVIFKGGTDQFAQKQNGPDAGAYAGGIVLHKGEILLNTNVFNMTEIQGNKLLWHQTAQTLIDAANNLGHELFHVLQGDCMIGCGTTSVSKPGYPRDQSEYNAYVVDAKINAELNKREYWDQTLKQDYVELDAFNPSADVGPSGTTPRDAALWKSLLVYPPKP